MFSFSQSVTLGLPSIHVNLMPRWIYTLSTLVLSKSTHNHEVTAMYLPQTTTTTTVSLIVCVIATWLLNDVVPEARLNKWMNYMNDSSCRTDRQELNLDIKQWNPPLLWIIYFCHTVSQCSTTMLEVRIDLTWNCCGRNISNLYFFFFFFLFWQNVVSSLHMCLQKTKY